MTNQANTTSKSQAVPAHEQAAWWVTRLYSGELSAREEAQIRHWRCAHAEHENAWQNALQAYDVSAQLYHRSSYPAARSERAQHDWRSWFASAASIALIAVVMLLSRGNATLPGAVEVTVAEAAVIAPRESANEMTAAGDQSFRITQKQQPDESGRKQYQTAVGEVSHIILADGSTLSLNTDSELSVEFTPHQRLVFLSRGEVFFDVAKDPQRPFVIDTGERRIEVLGTQFNVRKRHDEQVLKISVLEGKVAVHPSATTVTAIDARQQPLLAGDIASYSSNSQVVQQNQQRQVSSSQTWRQGIMRFENENLENVIKEFNRYRTRKIIIADDEVKQLRISGVFHLANGENILTALESTLPIQVQRDNQHTIIITQ